MMDELRRKAERRAAEATAKKLGITVEKVDGVLEEAQKTVRILSKMDVADALGYALVTVLGYESSLNNGPIILNILIHELFDKQEGE